MMPQGASSLEGEIRMNKRNSALLTLAAAVAATGWVLPATAVEEHYTLDPTHTYPSFEADHFGVSIWRGKMNKTTGTVVLDRAAHTGNVSLTIDLNSIDFGMDELNKWALGKDLFETSKFPTATYTGKFTQFKGDVPVSVDGQLTLHGVTKPVRLTINSFACKPHPMLKVDWCGADASATFSRDEFGLTTGKEYGFKMGVTLRIQVEATKDAKK
jgi:polyisoprenoid-binding protein YceI